MLFNSYSFVLLVLITFALFYWPLLRALQSYTLIAASLAFYAFGQPVLVILLLVSILINATSSYYILHSSALSTRKTWAVLGVGMNLAVLFFFKYGALAVNTFALGGSSLGHLIVTLPLPIGISFFTFQGISLVVDVFRQKEGQARLIQHRSAWHHFVDTALFKSFFPQLIAGPIVKAHDFYPQIVPKSFRAVAWGGVFRALVTGYFLKMVVADNLKDLTFWVAYPYFLNFSTPSLLAMLFGYSMQIFADFAGYSLIAIGVARLFGYELMENFNFPYISQSLSEFWRRWHISLSTWLREYLYFPLGGNRRGAVRTYLNLMLVMALGGLWHGAAWSYAVWGIFHGAGLAVERFFGWDKPARHALGAVLRGIGIFAFVTFGWLLFKLPNFSHFLIFVRTCCTNMGKPDDPRLIAYILFYSLPVVAYHALYLRKQRVGVAVPVRWQPLAYGACLFALLVNSGSPGAFIYFQF